MSEFVDKMRITDDSGNIKKEININFGDPLAREQSQKAVTTSEQAKQTAEEAKQIAQEAKDAVVEEVSQRVDEATQELSEQIDEAKQTAQEAIEANGSNLEKEITRAKQAETYLETQKANKKGYYKNLSVGVADNLSGRGEATESEFSMRPSGGENKSIPEDGTARINNINGNSAVYNQLSQIISLNITLSNDTSETVSKFVKTITTLTECNGHKLYVVAENNDDIYFILNIAPSVDISQGAIITCNIAENVIPALYAQIPPNTNKSVVINLRIVDLTKMFNGVNVPATAEEFGALYGNMPNEYNEGTIVDNHTTAIKSVGVNAWNEEITFATIGTESGNEFSNPERIASKNFCACIGGAKYYVSKPTDVDLNLLWYDKDKNYISFNYCSIYNEITSPTNAHFFKINLYQTYGTTYKHDICIHLVHTGYLNGKYFPYESQTRELPTVDGGLKSAGKAYDEIRYNNGKDKWEYVQRIGQVDLGTLEWGISPTGTDGVVRFYSSEISGAVSVSTASEIGNIICDKYVSVNAGDTWDLVKGVAINLDAPRLFIYDSTYTDATTFKAAMQGVILYYELVTSIVTELDVDISPDYKVWDYGTEEAISDVLSTPVRTNANYGFNAVGQITDNTILIQELIDRVAVLEAQIAQANSANVDQIEPVVE